MVLIITIHTHFKANKKFICNKMGEKTYKYPISHCRATLVRFTSNTCTAREPCLQYSWELQAILTGFTCNTRGLCSQYLAGLLVKPDSIAYKT